MTFCVLSFKQATEDTPWRAGHILLELAAQICGWLRRTGDTGVEAGLAWTDPTVNSITLYRSVTDAYWNYVRVRIWITREPTGVGGLWIPLDKLALLALYIALASTLLVATAATATYVKRRKEKQ